MYFDTVPFYLKLSNKKLNCPSLHILSLIGVRNSKESDQFNSIGVGEGRGRGRGGRKSGFEKESKNVKEG